MYALNTKRDKLKWAWIYINEKYSGTNNTVVKKTTLRLKLWYFWTLNTTIVQYMVTHKGQNYKDNLKLLKFDDSKVKLSLVPWTLLLL